MPRSLPPRQQIPLDKRSSDDDRISEEAPQIGDLPKQEEPEQKEPEQEETAREETGKGGRKQRYDLTTLISLAPFMDQETLDRAALELASGPELKSLPGLAPFVSSKVLGEIVRQNAGSLPKGTLAALAPFLEKDVLELLFVR